MTHGKFTQNQQCQYLSRTVGNNGSSTSFVHASDDFVYLILWHGIPFNDDRIFQYPEKSWKEDDCLEFVCLACPKYVWLEPDQENDSTRVMC